MFVKICGITRAEDAQAAVECGASALGFVFWPESPRFLEPDRARAIIETLPSSVAAVGVFVNQPASYVNGVASLARLAAVQLHGDETTAFAAEMTRPVIKTVAPGDDAQAVGDWPESVTLLVDAKDPVRRGGTGLRADWLAAAAVARERRLLLAGGLTPENVADAIAQVRPFGIDVSSGVEQSPGVKDHERLKALFEVVRSAEAESLRSKPRSLAREGGALGAGAEKMTASKLVTIRRDPDARGYFGEFGGRYVPETLVEPVEELERAYYAAREDAAFLEELDRLLKHYVGRPTPVYEAKRLSEAFGGARIFLKREDLAHTGAHKINNALGQALLAVRMGKRRIVAETGAGQHGVAAATACALLGLECHVYMGAEDMDRQALNVFRMRLLGADVHRVDAGSRTLKDAINEAMRDWVTKVGDTYYLLGSVLGPHPYPLMVREFQSVIGREAKQQIVELAGRLPDAIVACVGGGSNSMGIFDAFIGDGDVRLVGVEAGGDEIVRGRHAARFAGGSAGVLQGTRTFVLQDEDGNIELTHSISAGLDYAAVGPEHAWLRSLGRTEYAHVSDGAALAAFETLARLEGILPALESAHAIAYAEHLARELGPSKIVLVNLSGRGDKDVETVEKAIAKR